MWSPEQYERFRDERSRPFFDLVGRITTASVRLAVDLGCGTAKLTRSLAARWPDARVVGVDSSREMIEASRSGALRGDGVELVLGALETWTPPAPVDVLVANASLQWVDDHGPLVDRLAGFLAPGGSLAVQMPANFDQPSHLLLAEVRRSPRWAPKLASLPDRGIPVEPIGFYVERLAAAGLDVDAWETTYVHVLPGEDAVLEWTSGTALRPVLAALSPSDADAFRVEYGARLREAYPQRSFGTLLPFRRVFFVARRA